MTTKEYLKQIKVLDHKIKHKENQLAELRARIMQAGGVNYGRERVQSSPKGDKMAEDVIRMIELEEQISAERAAYFKKKQEIVNRIHRMDEAAYIDVLIKRYVELKGFEVIAEEMHYSISYTYELHRKALHAFALLRA